MTTSYEQKPEKLPAQDIKKSWVTFFEKHQKEPELKQIESELKQVTPIFSSLQVLNLLHLALKFFSLNTYTPASSSHLSNHYLYCYDKNGIFRLISILCLEKIKY